MERKDQDPAFLWDLSDIYASKEAWEKDYAGAGELLKKVPSVAGTLGESPEKLKAGLDTVYSCFRVIEKVYCYAFLYKSGNNGDTCAQEMESKAIGLSVSASTECAFLSPELLKIEKLDEWSELPELGEYRHILKNELRARGHSLDEQGERLLAMLGDAATAPQNAFEMFEAVDMSFPETLGDDGKNHPLTHGTFGVFRESRNQKVREEAFSKYFGEFKRYENTLAALYSGSVKLDCYFAAAKKHESACASALFKSNVPTEVYEALVSAVHDGIDDMDRYLELRKKALKTDKLHLYDLYCPMVENIDYEISYREACGLVLKAVEPMGEKYVSLIKKAMDEKWIDIYENRGKTTGAFSMGVYGVHPYVLLNYSGKLDDAFTLAHELGHAMHSYLSDNTQSFPNHDYHIFAAEVASTVNEVLLTKYLLSKETEKKRRAYIINHFLEGYRTTVFRQTLFAEFEKKAHEMYESGVPLTADGLSAVYRELNGFYYRKAENDPIFDIEWARIPHFYNAFYVYQYATGFCSAVKIAENIANGENIEGYIRFLSSGGSDYPIEELKYAGVDLTDPETFKNALRGFGDRITELEKLI